MNKRKIGTLYEKKISHFLSEQGFRILKHGFSISRVGEIDLIAEDGHELVFIEVRFRVSGSESAIIGFSPSKKKRVLRTAKYFLRNYHGAAQEVRFDLIAVDQENCIHIKNAW